MAWGWFYLQAWLKIAKNFSFSNHSVPVVFTFSSNSLCFPFVSRYFPSTAKNTRKVFFFFLSPVGPSLIPPPGKGPCVCKGPKFEKIIGRQQGGSHGAAATCHLHHQDCTGPSGLRSTLRSVAITNYSQSIRCCETWCLRCIFLTVRFFFS